MLLAPSVGPKCEHIEGSTDFSFQTKISQFCLNFHQQNSLKNQYLPHLSSENCEIIIQLAKGFPTTPRTPQNSILILYSFHWESGPIINNLQCSSEQTETKSVHPTHWRALQRYQEWHEAPWFGTSQGDNQNKTNYLASHTDITTLWELVLSWPENHHCTLCTHITNTHILHRLLLAKIGSDPSQIKG